MMESLPSLPKVETETHFSEEDEDPFLKANYGKSLGGDLMKIDKSEFENGNDLEDLDPYLESDEEEKKVGSRRKRRSPRNKLSKGRLRVRYPCPKCSKTFHHVRLFNDHLAAHEATAPPKKIYKCLYSNCEREFSSETGLKNHFNYHTSTSDFLKCLHCSEEFESIEKLNIHELENHKEESNSGIVGHSYTSALDKLKRNMKRKKWHKCEHCDKQFGNITIYNKHLLVHQDLGKTSDIYKCSDCGREFYSEHGMKVHRRNSSCAENRAIRVNRESSENPVIISGTSKKVGKKCPECPREFSEMLKLDIHLVSVHLKDPKCSECGKTFPNGPRLFRHHNVHKLPGFKCPHEGCTALFRTKEGLVVHRRKHDGILPYICPVCKEGFPTKPSCVRHRIEVHGQNIKPIVNITHRPNNRKSKLKFPCPVPGCDTVFKYEKSLNIHKRKHEGLPAYVCPVCQQAFPMKQQCLQHRIEVHKEKLKKLWLGQIFQCETCGSTFKNPYTLNNHIKREHSLQKNFECDICGKKFSLEYDFKVHKSYHASAGSFICEECGKSFNSKSDLMRHSMSHKPDTEKPFQCSICGKGFVRKLHFEEHTKIHTGEKPKTKRVHSKTKKDTPNEQGISTCPYCDKTWTSKEAQRSHLRRIHGKNIQGQNVGRPKQRLYQCDLCPKVFHKKIRVADHYKNVHGKEYPILPTAAKVPRSKINSSPPPRESCETSNYDSTELSEQSEATSSSPYPLWGGEMGNPYNYGTVIPTTTTRISQLHQALANPKPGESLYYNSNSSLVLGASNGLSAYPNPHQQLQLQPQPNYFLAGGDIGNLTGRNIESVSNLNLTEKHSIVSNANLPVITPAATATVSENVQTETIMIPSTKWESTFESDMGFDDFFDDTSDNMFFEDMPGGDGPSLLVKKESEENSFFRSQGKSARLTKSEKELVKAVIGSRSFSLTIKKIATYPCKLCKLEFHRKDLQEKHSRSVRHWQEVHRITEKEKEVAEKKESEESGVVRKCSICGLIFATLKVLVEHCQTAHAGQKAFSCDFCGTAYYDYKHLRHHKSTFHKDDDHVCVVCKEKFTPYSVYRRHITSAHVNAERKCCLCDKTFTKLIRLQDHCEKEHPGEKPYVCDICGVAYLRFKDFRNHRSRFHLKDDPTNIRKPVIGRTKDPRTTCEICGKMYGNMKAHMLIHTGERNHLCDLCGKSFGKKGNLVSHKRRHLGETRFTCPDCGKQFYRKRDLRLHSAIHNKNFSCHVCHLKFTTTSLLDKHMGLHDSNRPFNCRICGLFFNFRGNLATHVKKLHPFHLDYQI